RALEHLPASAQVDWDHECFTARLNICDLNLSFDVERGDPVICMTMRDHFDQVMIDVAEGAGAQLRFECAVEGINHLGKHVELVTDQGTIDADFVIAADGALSVTARAAGWSDALDGIPALEWEVRVSKKTLNRFRDVARFDIGWVPHGYAWVFPKRKHLSIGVLNMLRGAIHLKAELQRYVDEIGISDIRHIDAHGYLIPVRPRRRLIKGRVLVAGDAAGLADPITGEGIANALVSGRLAAEAIVGGAFDPWHVEHLYESTMKDQVTAELRLARILAYGLYRMPRARVWFMEQFGADFSAAMTDIICGRRSYRDAMFSPRNFARLIANKWRARRDPIDDDREGQAIDDDSRDD
ncbi:MAG: FAD-dependent monooxygenase, partial [Myxococcota bacterium]